MTAEQDQRISEVIELEQARLRNFIRKRVPDTADAEDILQEVFYELVEAYRLLKPIEQVGAWLFRVARNRITDRFRKRSIEALPSDPMAVSEKQRGAGTGGSAPIAGSWTGSCLRTECTVGRAR
jgi:RNA polymerase sigma factor (sigma-70 family)